MWMMKPNWPCMVLYRYLSLFSFRALLSRETLPYPNSLQHYIKLSELEKNRKLNDLLDALDFNQVVIFVKSVSRAAELNKLLVECNFPSICIHSGMSQEERYVIFFKITFCTCNNDLRFICIIYFVVTYIILLCVTYMELSDLSRYEYSTYQLDIISHAK